MIQCKTALAVQELTEICKMGELRTSFFQWQILATKALVEYE